MRVLLAAPSASTIIPHFTTLHSVFIADDDAADERANEADSGAYAKYQTRNVDDGDDDVEDEEDGEGVLFVWRRAEDAYDRLAPLLGVEEFLMPALRGYVVAAGTLGWFSGIADSFVIVDGLIPLQAVWASQYNVRQSINSPHMYRS